MCKKRSLGTVSVILAAAAPENLVDLPHEAGKFGGGDRAAFMALGLGQTA
jgi:hypothetical protein